MRTLFLYGNNAENFAEVLEPFIEASGGSEAVIAWCCYDGKGWRPFFNDFEKICTTLGASKVLPVYPENGTTTLTENSLRNLKNATGIFITGGPTNAYHEIYMADEVADIITKKYMSGIPYAGLSAGAMLVTESVFCEEEGLAEEVDGFGFLKNALIIPHFSEWDMFNTMIKDLEIVKPLYGFGIDEPICLEIRGEKEINVLGEGALYLFRRNQDFEYLLNVFKKGNMFYCEHGLWK